MKLRHFLPCAWLSLAMLGASAAWAQADLPVGAVDTLQGEAYAIRADLSEVNLGPGVGLFRADAVQTLAAALLEIAMIDGSRLILDENSRISIADYVTGAEPRGRLNLLRGRLRATVSGSFSSRSDSFQIQTSEGVMGVQGTDFLVEAMPGETRVYVYSGLVLVTSLDPDFPDGVLLGPGQFIRIRLGQRPGEPIRFQAFLPRAEDPIGSGGEQQLRSGGDQGNDPLQQVPELSPLLIPPRPNPPGGREATSPARRR